MLPVEQGRGQIWRRGQFLCDAEYDISEPLRFTDSSQVQRIILTLPEEDQSLLLAAYGLTLVTADGSRCAIPRPMQRVGLGTLECYVESPS